MQDSADPGIKSQQELATNLNPAVELEVKEILESIRWLATQLVQVATVLTTANIALIGFAVSGTRAGLLLLGSGVTVLLFFTYRAGIKGIVPGFCRLLALEELIKQVAGTRSDTAITMLLLALLQPAQLSRAKDVNSITNLTEKRIAMKAIERDLLLHSSARTGLYLLGVSFTLQIVLVPLLVVFYGWNVL